MCFLSFDAITLLSFVRLLRLEAQIFLLIVWNDCNYTLLHGVHFSLDTLYIFVHIHNLTIEIF